MYRLDVFENKHSFKYRTSYSYFDWLWTARIASYFIIIFSDTHYKQTGVLTTTEITFIDYKSYLKQ